MMSWLFSKKKIKELELKNLELVLELQKCNDKVLEKQENINQTNSYWKKKMHDLKARSPKKKEL
jgi:hypothetical protein